MHLKLKFVALATAAALLVGCTEPKLDATTDEALKASAQKVRDSLPEAQRAKFDEAFQIVAVSKLDIAGMLSGKTDSNENLETRLRETFNGKTAAQVIAAADTVKTEREARERAQGLAEIQELEAKKLAATSAAEELKKFEVVRSRFSMEPQRYGRDQPIIELTVKNGTNAAISRAYFTGIIASPGRSVPWHKEDFNYSISGGLEPGESATWRLAPNMLSNWGSVDAPDDAILTVTVKRLDGPDEKALFSLQDFGEPQEQRLIELKQKLGVS